MSKTTASAAGAAMPAAATSRRSLLVALAATPALAVPAMASAAQGDDAELLALEAEICRLNEQSDEIIATRADPFEQEYDRILAPKSANFEEAITNETWKAASEFGERCGRTAAIEEAGGLLDRAYRLYDRMREIPARTQAGRQAKVRALIVHILRDEWRGTKREIDSPEKEFTRELLGELSGLTEAELAAI